MLVAASMPFLFVVQQWAGEASFALAFQPASLRTGGWWPGLLTSMFLHANWPHVLMNATGALAFGTPVARLLPGARGAAAYLAFYIACGLVAAVGYGLVHPTSPGLVVGASGAVFGLMGAAIRLLGRRDGRLRPLTDRRVVTIAAVLMAVNAGAGLIGLAPGMEGLAIAWEAHAFGFLFGLLTIDFLARFGRRRDTAFDSAPDPGDPSG